MSRHLGYIVQIQTDDDYTPYHGGVTLYRSFRDALQKAKDVLAHYLETHVENYDGPFEMMNPRQEQCDNAGSVVFFRSSNCILWIDTVVE